MSKLRLFRRKDNKGAKDGDNRNDAKKSVAVTIIVALVGSSVVSGFVLPTLWSGLVATPSFQVSVSFDLSSLNVTNTGETVAHQVKVTLETPANHSLFVGFSSENVTWSKPSYDVERDLTILSASLARLGEQAVVSIRFPVAPKHIELWVSSNEIGDHWSEPSSRSNGILDQLAGRVQTAGFWAQFLAILAFLLAFGVYVRVKRVELRNFIGWWRPRHFE